MDVGANPGGAQFGGFAQPMYFFVQGHDLTL